MTLKELKIAHRNQTILTGGSGSSNCDDDIPFDFGAVVTAGATRTIINNKNIVNEPMELDRIVIGKLHTDRDIEMETIVESVTSTATGQQTKPAIRPTTLNIPGGATIDFSFFFFKKKYSLISIFIYCKKHIFILFLIYTLCPSIFV